MVSGYVRGRALSVNGLLHIPDVGDFQMTQVHSERVCVCVCVCMCVCVCVCVLHVHA